MGDIVFIVGCPRSGTTWMQLLLAQHPEVATQNETFLFYRYINGLWREWTLEEDRYSRPVGLRQLFTEEEFLELCRGFARRVLRKIATPKSSVVVEKTPGHATCGRLILDCFPDAYFLHVVRDPRDVATSLMAAEATWAEGWAPGNAHDAAHMWRRLVSASHGISKLTGRYRTVRYEDLQTSAEDELAEILDWLSLPHTPDLCREAARSTSIDSVAEGRSEKKSSADRPWDTTQEPDGFFRKGTSGSWESELTPFEIHTVEYVAQNLMKLFGYPTDSPLLTIPPVPEVRRRVSQVVRRALSLTAR